MELKKMANSKTIAFLSPIIPSEVPGQKYFFVQELRGGYTRQIWDFVFHFPENMTEDSMREMILSSESNEYDQIVFTENCVLSVTDAPLIIKPIPGCNGIFSESGALAGQLYSDEECLQYSSEDVPHLEYQDAGITSPNRRHKAIWTYPEDPENWIVPVKSKSCGDSRAVRIYTPEGSEAFTFRKDERPEGVTVNGRFIKLPSRALEWAIRNAA